MESKLENAKSAVLNCRQPKDVGEIAWRVLLGNRILEYLNDMEEEVPRGTDFQVIAANLDSYVLRIGNVKIHLTAIKPNGGKDIP